MSVPRLRLSLVVACCALLMAACSARGKPSSIETNLANAAKDVVIPMEAENAKNPTPETNLTLAQGQAVYDAHCSICHSANGHSQTQLGLDMYPPAMDLTSPHVQAWKDQELYWIIQNGIRLTGMPAWQGVISNQDTWKVARFVHALPHLPPQQLQALTALLAPPAPQPVPTLARVAPRHGTLGPASPKAAAPALAQQIAYGRHLVHQEGCLKCHTFDGEGSGDGDGPDLTHEAARKRSVAWLTGHFQDPQAYDPDTDMPSFSNLAPEQLQALITLLKNAH